MNEKSRNNIDMGVDVGCPDLIITKVKAGIFFVFFLELKKSDGTLKKSQRDWAENFDKYPSSNATRAVAYGYDEAKQLIDRWIGK